MRTSIMAMHAMNRRQATSRKVLGSLLMVAAWLVLGIVPVHAGTPTMKTTVRLIVTNAQGTVVATMTPQGQVTYTAAYRPYGKQAEGTPKPGPGYTGHVNDPDTGLVYMQQRYYDPGIGFISPDPVMPTPGNIYNFNRYAYANNNPIRYTDPDGRCVVCVVILGAIIAGAIDTAVQEWRHPDQPVNKTEVTIAAVGGGITAGSASALSGAAVEGTITVGQAVFRQAAVNGVVGGGQSVANDLADGKPVSGQRAVNAAGVGVATSLLGSGVSAATGEFNGASASGALNDMSKASVNAPAGIGHAIAETTKAAGKSGAAQTTVQTVASQTSSAIINTSGDVATEDLNKRIGE